MTYNTRKWSNDRTESQKEKKSCFRCVFLEQDVVIKKLNYVKV